MVTSIYLTNKLRLVTNGIFKHWCPGCKVSHQIDIFNKNNHCWSFNGNIDRPTFRPSMKVYINEIMVCHYNLVQGVIHYLGDSAHELADQSITMSIIPVEEH